jgi:hypothetical protein
MPADHRVSRPAPVSRRIDLHWDGGEERPNGDLAIDWRGAHPPPSATDHHPPVAGAFARLLVIWKLEECEESIAKDTAPTAPTAPDPAVSPA